MNQKSIESWKQRIADRESSGLNVQEWCDQNGLSKDAYYYWRKKVKNSQKATPYSEPVFVELEPSAIPESRHEPSNLKISWKGMELLVNNTDTAKLAAEFFAQLQRLC